MRTVHHQQSALLGIVPDRAPEKRAILSAMAAKMDRALLAIERTVLDG